MPLEIEIKLKVESHEPTIERLRPLNAEHRGIAREQNLFFDRPDRSVRAAESSLRVRFTTSAENPNPIALITFKQPPGNDVLGSREALDLTVAPHDQAVPLLQALGFELQFLFEKDRQTWSLESCLVELDTLPIFGRFIEIEGPSVDAVRHVQDLLSLSSLPPYEISYSRMVSEHLRREGKKELRFNRSGIASSES